MVFHVRLGSVLGAMLFVGSLTAAMTLVQAWEGDESDRTSARAPADRAKKPLRRDKSSKTTDKKRGRYDAIVEAFIAYDVGQLRGNAGFQANQGFQSLSGDDAIPALVRGANQAAYIRNSCPIIIIAAKLRSLLEQAKSREALQYAAAHLDASGANAVYGSYVESLRTNAKELLRRFDGLPPAADNETEVRGGGTPGQLRRSRKPIGEWSQADLLEVVVTEKGTSVVQALEELKDRKGQESTETLAKAVEAIADDTKDLARGLLAQRLARMTDKTLKAKLADDNVEIRAAAASAIGYKGSPLCDELVKAVADGSKLVAANAHQSLVKLSGEDLGPSEGAKYAERFAASKRWQRWIDERPDESGAK